MIIAVDFDGTIVEDRYPGIGHEIPFATSTLKMLMQEGHQLILWTVRRGRTLDEALHWCQKHGVEFYAVNQSFPGENSDDPESQYSRKLKADLFIDDRNVGGLPDWGTIYQIIHERRSYEDVLLSQGDDYRPPRAKRHWWQF